MAPTTRIAWTALALALAVALDAPVAVADQTARGRDLFVLCSQCHGERGEGNPEALAPSIAGLQQWYVEAQLRKFQNGWRGGHPEDIAGLRMRPMSRWLKSDEDLQAVAAHVASLAPLNPAPTLSGGDAQRGEALYATCIACHQPDGVGNQALNAPSLVHANDWYLLTQLTHFHAGIRGGVPEDANGVIMRAMSMTLPDEQSRKDVIAYVLTLRQQTASAPQ